MTKFKELFPELVDMYLGCSEKNWDGYDADPIPIEAYDDVIRVVAALPDCIDEWDISPAPDGSILLEWRNKKVIIAVNGCGRGVFETDNFQIEFNTDQKLPAEALDILSN